MTIEPSLLPAALLRRTLRGAVAAVLGAATVAAAAAAEPSVAQPAVAPVEQQELQRAREQIEAVARALAGAETTATRRQRVLAEADRHLDALERAVNEVAAAVHRQDLAVEQARRRHTELREEVARLQHALRARAVELYKQGTTLPFELLANSGDVEMAMQRSAILQVITETDRANLEAATNARRALASQRKLLAHEQRRLAQLEAEQESLLADALALRDSRSLAAAAARDRVDELARQRDSLTAEAEALEDLIRDARFTPMRKATPSGSGLVWPRCDTVTSEYGRRWRRLHAGLDIGGEPGEPIAAARAGVVVFAGWRGGYGQLVLIDHGGGLVTASAHQSKLYVAEGQQVLRGQRIGEVGSTGNSTGPHLHFETRVDGQPVNPRQFLPGGC